MKLLVNKICNKQDKVIIKVKVKNWDSVKLILLLCVLMYKMFDKKCLIVFYFKLNYNVYVNVKYNRWKVLLIFYFL